MCNAHIWKLSYAQPLDYLINKILSQDESINSSKILIEKVKMMFPLHGLHILLN